MMKYRYLRAFLLVGLGLLLVSCSITRVKWRIKWDKDKQAGKKAFLSAPLKTEKTERQPNVIILLADDLGPYEVSAYGVEHIKTPHIDRLAVEGMLFERAFASNAVCSPTRAGLLTGRYQQRAGIEAVIHPVDDHPEHRKGLQESETTFAEVLQEAGYRTGFVGKFGVK